MSRIVVYKSKYGATKTYAEYIAKELSCRVEKAEEITKEELLGFDEIIYGGGLYAEMIDGISLITKNIESLRDKKIVIFTTGLTPVSVREYYDKMVIDKNFKNIDMSNIKVFNFSGKMIIKELSFAHKAALKALEKIMKAKKNPSEMEMLLIDLCTKSVDEVDVCMADELIEYVK